MIGLGISIPKIAINSEGGSLASLVSSLFRNNEQGVWYDPSDFSTMFEDASGVTPVTGVEKPVGLILDKSKGLVLGPELIPNGDFSSSTGWALSTGVTISNGVCTFTNVAGGNSGAVRLGLLTTGKRYRVTVTVLAVSGGPIYCFFAGSESPIISSPGTYTFDVSAGSTTTNFGVVLKLAGPVNAVIDNVSVKEVLGNHATQTTSISRPVLSARVNLLTKTEQFDDAVWVKNSGATVIANVEGNADKVVAGTSLASQILTQGLIVVSPNTTYKLSIKAKKAGYRYFYFAVIGAPTAGRIFDFDTGSYTATQAGTATYESQLLSDGFYLLTQTFTTGSSVGNIIAELGIRETPSFDAFTGDGVSGALVKEADLRVANVGTNLPAYQRVNTATDYDTAGFPHYLHFNGADTFLVTPSIDFTSTDKMTVFAGIRKLIDSNTPGVLVELSTNSNVNNGSFLMTANDAGSFAYIAYSKGTEPWRHAISPLSYYAPDSRVLRLTSDIAGSLVTLGVNGVQVQQDTSSQGTGNYGNYPLYIGRRGGTQLPFNGRLYSLIVRGAQSRDDQITQTEKFIASKTGITL